MAISIAIPPTAAPGNFSLAHGLGYTPTAATISMSSGGLIWFQYPISWDATFFYLTASDSDLTGFIIPFESGFTPPTPVGPYTIPVSAILNSVANDLLQGIAAEAQELIDYINRVSLEILRTSRWKFLEQGPVNFITQMEQTDYWVGPVGQGPDTAVDTLLNLQNLGIVKENTVYDYSNFTILQRVANAPLYNSLGFPDSLSRPGKPAVWRNDPDSPQIVNIYPAPNNQNNYLPEPPAPICVTTPGGSLPLRTYYVTVTYVDSYGYESIPSDNATIIVVPANSLLVVKPPKVGIQVDTRGVSYNQYNVYAANAFATLPGPALDNATSTTQLPLQSVAPQTLAWAEPTSGLVTGTAYAPQTNNITPLDGYIIRFKYYADRIQLTQSLQFLQIPDYYKDIVVAGVNWYAAQFLERQQPMQFWGAMYKDGLRQMIRDKNLFPRGSGDYIAPDGATIAVKLPSIETVNLANSNLM